MNRILVFSILCFIALCAGVYMGFPHAEISIGAFNAKDEQIPEKTTPPITTVRFVGDIMLARNVEYLMNQYGHSYPYDAMPVHPEQALLVGNFEGSVPAVHVPTKSMQFAFSIRPEFLLELADYGFTHLSLANNHSHDFGLDDLDITKAELGKYFGVFGDQLELSPDSVELLSVGSSTIAIIGVYAVDVQPQLAQIIDVLEYAESISTYQIMYVHWGTEYAPVHSSVQERLAYQAIDAGADAVVGHHPHVVQDIEIYKNAPIFYSLGNFIFDQYFSEEVQTGLMVELTPLEDTFVFELLPVTSIGSRSQVRFMGPYEKDVFLEELAKKSEPALTEAIRSGVVESRF